jgi:hypothetical protein
MENMEKPQAILSLFSELKKGGALTVTQIWKKHYRSPGPAIRDLRRLEELGFIEDKNNPLLTPRSKNGGGRGCQYILTSKGKEEYERQKTEEMLQKLETLSNVNQPVLLLDDFEILLREFEAETTTYLNELTDSLTSPEPDEYRNTVQKLSSDISSFNYSEERRHLDKIVRDCNRQKCFHEIKELFTKFKGAYLTIKELQSDIEKLRGSLEVFRMGFNTYSEDPRQVTTGQPVYSELLIQIEHEGIRKSVPISQVQQYLPPEIWSVWAPRIQKLIDDHKQKTQIHTSRTDSSKSVHADLCIGKFPELSLPPVAQKYTGTALFEEFEQYKKKTDADNAIAHTKLIREIIEHNIDSPSPSEQADIVDIERKKSVTHNKSEK